MRCPSVGEAVQRAGARRPVGVAASGILRNGPPASRASLAAVVAAAAAGRAV